MQHRPGESLLVADMTRPGLLHGAVVLSAHARAKIKKIDTSKARALPGVVAVMTAEDVPGARSQGSLERDWPLFAAEGDEARCMGDILAAIAADDLTIAREAADLVAIEYEVLEPILDPEAALSPSAPRINPRHENLLGRSVIRRGDAAEALAQSRYVARGVFFTQRIEHLFLEPEWAFAEMLPDGCLSVYSQEQGVHDEQGQIASVLGWSADRVVVHNVANGRASSGKGDLTIEAHAALLAWKTGRPVKLLLDREQSIRMHPQRHPMRIEYEVGCDIEGHLTAVCARILGDGGAYASIGAKVLERAAGHAAGVYHVPHLDVEAQAAYTNNPSSGAMRRLGVPQVTFALESCIDELAEMAGIDRWAIRYRNAVRAGDPVTTGRIFEKSVGIEQCLLAVKSAWNDAKQEGRAVGIACGINDSGGEFCEGTYEFGAQLVVLDETGRVERVVAAHDVGRVANPAFYKGRIQSAIYMGLGKALTEELACDKGMPTTSWLHDSGVQRTRGRPDVEVILVDEPESNGPLEVESIGEIGLVPTAAALASALRAGDGTQRRALPMKDATPANVVRAKPQQSHHRGPRAVRLAIYKGRH